MFKRFICIITIIALIASMLCISAGAAGTVQGSVEATYYRNNIMGTDIALYGANGKWFRYQYDEEGLSPMVQEMYTAAPVQWGQYASYASDVLQGFGYIFESAALDLASYIEKFKLGSFERAANKFMLEVDDGIGTQYSIFSVMGMSNNTQNNITKLQVFEGVDGLQDIRHVWYDGTPVDFNSLNACCTFLQNQGMLCQIIRVPYYVVLGTDTYRYGEMHCIAFYGSLSGGFSYNVSNYQVTGDWYILGDNNGSYFGAVYGETVTGDDVKVTQPFSPDSSFETDDRDYIFPSIDTDIDIDFPLTYWDGDEFLFYDFSTNTTIPIGAYMYNPSWYQYQFYNVDNSTTVNITYNIDYTQVSYIGASEEYEPYELYYQLPDGRSSADMTAEDLEQLNLSYDVINYGKSADDGRLRSLYHLDGNTEDSSYWVNDTSFTWDVNPSIEYLEATNFEGCLYLDEQDHKFTLKLPSNLSASDFSLMFRYYHYGYGDTENNTATNYTDLVVQSTSSTTQNAYSTLFTNLAGTLTTNSTTPIGVWSEVAIIRDGAMLYTYVNGLVIDSTAFVDVLGDQIVFDFKDVSVRRQIDEIRVFNYAMYEAGESYTPITVPMDTNLVLVLPDEGIPLPDGYWDFNTNGNLLSVYDFTGGSPLDFTDNTSAYSLGFTVGANTFEHNAPAGKFTFVTGREPSVSVNTDFFHISSPLNQTYNGFSSSAFNSNIPIWYWTSGSGYLNTGNATSGRTPYYVESIACFNVAGGGQLQTLNPYSLVSGDMISYSLVFKDGTQVSSSIVVPDFLASYNPASIVSDVKSYDWGDFGLVCSEASGGYGYYIYLVLNPNETGFDLVYRELKVGSPNDNTDAYKTVIYNESEIDPNTIAIRTTVPVRSWRIGGVRPTLPYRGDVWLMVQDERVTSSQIYNGYMWVSCDIRIWTGERWAWPNYFNILTQQDMTDIKGTTDNVYIQDTDGYYSWITEQWKSLLDLLNTIATLLTEIDGGGDVTIDLDFNFDGTISIEFITSVEKSRDGMFLILQEFWDGLFNPAFEGLSSGTTSFIDLFNPDNTTVTINGETVYTPGGLLGKEYDFEV